MKILMLTPYLPYPPSSGGQVRSYNLIKKLGKKHDITLFSLIKDDNEKKYIPQLEKYCKKVAVFKRPKTPWTLRNILLTGFGPYPFLVIRNLVPEERAAVKEEMSKEKYDLIHAETFYVMPHIPKTDIPILLVEQTIEFQVYQHFVDSFKFFFLKPFLYIDVFKIRYWETKFWQKAKKVVAVSQADKTKMLSLVTGLDVEIVPNGAGEDLVNLWDIRQKKRDKAKPIVFYQGNFNWLQNTEAAETLIKDIFPKIKAKIPQAVCWIVGQGVREKIGKLSGNGVEIKNLETSDIDGVINAYKNADIFVAPLAGPGGTRLKILGAMAAGIPVVTTSVGIEGIKAEDGKEVWIRDDPNEIARAAIDLIQDAQKYNRTITAARKLFENDYNWNKISLELDKIYREVGNAKKS
ncbi:MAG: glycosyltransferase family 4 protein [Patescibacteria group bacterium]